MIHTNDSLMEDIFKEVKEKRKVRYIDLKYKNADNLDIRLAVNKLIVNYNLIDSNLQTLTISEKGENFNTVREYLDSLKPKKDYNNLLKITSIIVTSLLSGITIYQNYSYRNLKDDYQSLAPLYIDLKSSQDSLKIALRTYKDSLFDVRATLNELTKELNKCTSRTKKIDSLKN